MIRKTLAIVGSAVFLVIAPGVVAGLVPWWISGWRIGAPFFGIRLLPFAGGILIGLGAIGLLDPFVRFAVQGEGTPAPVFPTRRLVVTGPYRYVRNPMYVSVMGVILGQGLLFGNAALLGYGGLVWLLFHLFVLGYEEPALRASFGAEYKVFCAGVPRWLPRLTHGEARDGGGCRLTVSDAIRPASLVTETEGSWWWEAIRSGAAAKADDPMVLACPIDSMAPVSGDRSFGGSRS